MLQINTSRWKRQSLYGYQYLDSSRIYEIKGNLKKLRNSERGNEVTEAEFKPILKVWLLLWRLVFHFHEMCLNDLQLNNQFKASFLKDYVFTRIVSSFPTSLQWLRIWRARFSSQISFVDRVINQKRIYRSISFNLFFR